MVLRTASRRSKCCELLGVKLDMKPLASRPYIHSSSVYCTLIASSEISFIATIDQMYVTANSSCQSKCVTCILIPTTNATLMKALLKTPLSFDYVVRAAL